MFNTIDNDKPFGLVEVYERNSVDQTWVRRGEGIPGYAAGDSFGSSVALSSNGNITVSSGRFNDENGINSGKVQVYIFDEDAGNSGSWSQHGVDIVGNKDDLAGAVVAISSDGDVVAVGFPGNADRTGLVRVYMFNNNAWIPRGILSEKLPTTV